MAVDGRPRESRHRLGTHRCIGLYASERPRAALRGIRAAAGLDWLRLHDLRHACATFLLVSGASPRTVMKVPGHSQIGLTMNTYAHVLPDIERAAVDEAAKHLFG
ncbi:tyrosine-type recombinase/integrase [Micromonospora sp. AP08]|nr:tyrosine-type recombinase/integrase [Micromonospora sp. AP08]